MISPITIEKVKDAPIYDVVSSYVTDLKKSGQHSWTALSPFTNEKTPSFYVVPKKNIFYCFSSGKGGGPIRFVMEHEKCTYPEAIIAICKIVNEPVVYESNDKATQEQLSEREELFKLNHAAAKRWHDLLIGELANPGHVAVAELTRRGYTKEIIAQWEIGFAPIHPFAEVNGYAPQHWRFLTEILHEKGLVAPALKIGLVTEKDKTVYDTFRNRVMFPIHNHHGRIGGFGGRAIKQDPYNPKYLNTAESVLFDKKSTLYGLHFAGRNIRENGWAGLVEGYTDVISLHQGGIDNAVGTCGTSLTDEQCRLLKKFCSKVILFPDPDDAGEKSAMRNIDLLMKEGFETAVVPMPKADDGRKIDPDELVRMFAALKAEVDKPKEKKKPNVKKKATKKKKQNGKN